MRSILSVDLQELKGMWVDVLDELERVDRIAWLAFFDARLAALEDGVLALDFSDPAKLAGGHDIVGLLPIERATALESAIKSVTGRDLRVTMSA